MSSQVGSLPSAAFGGNAGGGRLRGAARPQRRHGAGAGAAAGGKDERWENDGKTMGKPPKSWEIYGKSMGNAWKHREILGHLWKKHDVLSGN
jgi:hypothetical protein